MEHLAVAPIFQNHMIIQREKPVHVWGKGPENAIVTVQFTDQEVSCTVKDHSWMCTLKPVVEGKALSMQIRTDIPNFPEIEIQDIAVGDVWLAGGQSNMEYFLRYDEHWSEFCRQEKNPNIRMFNVPRLAFEGHQKDISDSGYWFEEQDPAWETFSAPGYVFARTIQPHINVPVGIIGCNWGGTPACAWVDESVLTGDLHVFLDEYEQEIGKWEPDELRKASLLGFAREDSPTFLESFKPVMYGLTHEEQQRWMEEHKEDAQIPMGPYHMYRPSGLFHRMLKPLIPFSIKGVLWYQGESDSGHPGVYDQMMKSLIESWRLLWQDNFPFLFVQLAPFGRWLECTNEGYAYVRRQQDLVSKTVKDAYMISIMDIGMYEDIHPKKKKEVGERLALLARGCVYGEKIVCQSPELKSVTISENILKLRFAHVGNKLHIEGEQLKSLRVFLNEKETKPLQSIVEEDAIVLRFVENLPEKIEVRFADDDYAEVNIFNQAGLPVKPFTYQTSRGK